MLRAILWAFQEKIDFLIIRYFGSLTEREVKSRGHAGLDNYSKNIACNPSLQGANKDKIVCYICRELYFGLFKKRLMG